MARELQNQGIEMKKKLKKSVSNIASVAKIVEIYRLTVMQFKGDIDFWFGYLEFCREMTWQDE